MSTPPEDRDLTHIDAPNADMYLPATLGIKGQSSKPQSVDQSKVIPVIDMAQGGFSNETDRIVYFNTTTPGAVTSLIIRPGCSCRNDAGDTPGNAPANRSPHHAVAHNTCMTLSLDGAGALLCTNKFIFLRIGLTQRAGVLVYYWFYNVVHEIEGAPTLPKIFSLNCQDLIVPQGYELVAAVGYEDNATNFPANTIISTYAQWTKKPLGTQLPY